MAADRGKPLRLYHTDTARSFRVLWCLHEMGLADRLELITMPFPPRVFHRPYLKLNPLGTIPYFEDLSTGASMTESCAIPLYLATRYGPTELTLEPGHAEWPELLNWLFHAEATLTFPQTVVLRYTLQEPGRADKAAEDYGNWYIARLKKLDLVLSDGREFLVAGRFTIADIAVTCAAGYALGRSGVGRYALHLGTNFGFEERYTEQTCAYMERHTSRPGWEAVPCLPRAWA